MKFSIVSQHPIFTVKYKKPVVITNDTRLLAHFLCQKRGKAYWFIQKKPIFLHQLPTADGSKYILDGKYDSTHLL